MEKSFDFGRLLKNHEKKHKRKPTQFVSVAGGVQKRLETNLKYRKSSRLTTFDSIRNLSRCSSPAPLSEAQQKVEHRKQQLEKWKEEKEKLKKQAASQKKKPFVTGVPHVPLKFVPPPPLPPVKPSTSGRVTRSQTARNSKQVTEKTEKTLSQSFAPKNASFKPPPLKNIPKVPYVNLMALKPIQNKKKNITFDPVLPKIQDHPTKEVRQTRSRTQIKPAVVHNTQSKVDVRPRGKTAKPFTKTNINFQSSSSSETDLKSPILRNRKLPPAPQTLFQSSTETDSSDQSPVHSIKPQSSTDSDQSPKPMSPIQTRSRKSLPESPILGSKTPRKSKSRMSDKQFTPKNPVPKSESSSEERLRSPKPTAVLMTPEPIAEEAKKISPCVTMSRGKDNARREMKKKLDEGLLDEDISDIDNIEPFRRQLASEIKRMTDMCEQWDRVLEQTVLPESIQECVLGAVGQARLLMSQKLQQFASLVERCARPEPGVALVTPADLHGFWDMVFMQVENVDMRFKKLEQLKARGWVEEQPTVVVNKARVRPAPRAKPAGTSRIKEMIAAARKAKKEVPKELPVPEKTFEAGFFCVKSPVRSPAPHQLSTPLGKPSLLKAVLSSEANKSASRNSASFAMLRASVFGKNIECEGVAPLPPTPSPQNIPTPYRSILKQTDTAKKSSTKSIKVVLFNQSYSELNVSSKLSDEKPECQELNVDSGLGSMDVEKEEKENSRRKSDRLTRQDATDEYSPIKTRSRRKSNVTQEKTQEKTGQETRRSTRKSRVLENVESNIKEATPKRTPRRNRMQEGTA